MTLLKGLIKESLQNDESQTLIVEGGDYVCLELSSSNFTRCPSQIETVNLIFIVGFYLLLLYILFEESLFYQGPGLCPFHFFRTDTLGLVQVRLFSSTRTNFFKHFLYTTSVSPLGSHRPFLHSNVVPS